MIPVPDYLKQYAVAEEQKGNLLSFNLRCTCGCESFSVLEKSYTDEEKRIVKAYERKFPSTGLHSIYGGTDSDGKPYSYIKIAGLFKKRIELPRTPVFMNIDIIKAVCPQCLNEIVVFDSRYYGYDAMIMDKVAEKEYNLHFSSINKSLYNIKVSVENAVSQEDFDKIAELESSVEFYSNSFYAISIYGVDEKGIKKQLFDMETA
ncbi:MAG: hypothetical protein IKJ88_02210 [Clostridia bacterium]|nr:hypothetical protein [Clostridia bacterium]